MRRKKNAPGSKTGAAAGNDDGDQLAAGFLGLLVILFVFLSFAGPLPWLVGSYTGSGHTYPAASILGKDAGGIDRVALSALTADIAQSFNAQQFVLNHHGQQQRSAIVDFGFSMDSGGTARAVWGLNAAPLRTKLELLLRGGTYAVKPVLYTDDALCESKIGGLVDADTVAVNAALYYDKTIKVKSDVIGERLNPVRTCQSIRDAVLANKYTASVSMDTVRASMTQEDIAPKLAEITGMAGRPLTFSYGSYSRTFRPDELLSFVMLAKEPGKPLAVSWDQGKLDNVITDMAKHVETYITPAVGNCEVMVSTGGTRLDRGYVKGVFTAQNAGRPTSYTLQTYTAAARTRSMSTTTITGVKGIVYLTYDDGMTYAGTIMHYAACYSIKVTFFEIGGRASVDAALLQQAIAEGHAVQSHGYTHAVYDYGTGHTYEWQFNDIKASIDAITSVTGVQPTYFRPPGGNRNADTYAAAAANGLKLVLWGVSSADTSNNSTSDICRNVVNGARAGYTVLMHSTKQKTANALPCIVEGLAAKGYAMQALR